jgi:hypothetical protein
VLVAEALDLPDLVAARPCDQQRGLVESAQQLAGAARRPVRSGARQADEVHRQVAVVGAAALVGPVDELCEPAGDLAGGPAPAVERLLREQPRRASGAAHRLRERVLGGGVALGVDDDDLPVARARNAVGEAAEGDGLAGAGSADDEHRAPQSRERHQDVPALAGEHVASSNVLAELEDGLGARLLAHAELAARRRARSARRSSRSRSSSTVLRRKVTIPSATVKHSGARAVANRGCEATRRRVQRGRAQASRRGRRRCARGACRG